MIVYNTETNTVTPYFHRLAYLRMIRNNKEVRYEFFRFVPWVDHPTKSCKEWNGWTLVSVSTIAGDIVKITTPAARDIVANLPPNRFAHLYALQHKMFMEGISNVPSR